MPTAWTRPILRARLTEGRKLDTGNPNPGHIGSDFKRFALDLWPAMLAADARNGGRKARLEQLNRWRNAIAHQDFTRTTELDLGSRRVDLRLAFVTAWRSACEHLASAMDAALHAHLTGLAGHPPW